MSTPATESAVPPSDRPKFDGVYVRRVSDQDAYVAVEHGHRIFMFMSVHGCIRAKDADTGADLVLAVGEGDLLHPHPRPSR